jgi:hypothetical protein
LVFNFLVELADFILEIINLELVKHHDFVVTMVTEEAFEADGA